MRDIRDPKQLGMWILSRKEMIPAATICSIADSAVNAQHPDYSRTESTVDLTKALYQQQMTEQAARGDRYARRVCQDHGWAYDTTCAESNGQSVRERTSRSCVETMPHDPHMWTRMTRTESGPHAELYACPGRDRQTP